jgi:hypothetical protein
MNPCLATADGVCTVLFSAGKLARCVALACAIVVSGEGSARGADPSPRGGIARALQKPITVEFDRNNLEVTLDIISEETDIPIEILKTDLQLEGIINCQSHGLEARNMPAGQVLRICLKKANRDGKLIYVIRREAADRPEKLFITTQAAAAKRGDRVPAEFIQAAQRLAQPIDFRSDGETAALGILSVCAAVGLEYEILRGDLAAAEITDRALPEFEVKQMPAGEVLQKILAVQDPSGKLIYVIKTPKPGERERLYITTRDGAAKRDDRIPEEFESPAGKP